MPTYSEVGVEDTVCTNHAIRLYVSTCDPTPASTALYVLYSSIYHELRFFG